VRIEPADRRNRPIAARRHLRVARLLRRAIGEMASCSPAAAIANAVADAVGVRVLDLPVTAEKVYRELKKRN